MCVARYVLGDKETGDTSCTLQATSYRLQAAIWSLEPRACNL